MLALGKLQTFEFDAVGPDVRQIVMRLLRKPTCGTATENLRQSHGHFRGDSALAIDQLRQSGARNAESSGGVGDSQAKGFDTLTQYKPPRMRWVFHGHEQLSILMIYAHVGFRNE